MNKVFKAWVSIVERRKWKRKFGEGKKKKTTGAFGKPKWMRTEKKGKGFTVRKV